MTYYSDRTNVECLVYKEKSKFLEQAQLYFTYFLCVLRYDLSKLTLTIKWFFMCFIASDKFYGLDYETRKDDDGTNSPY